MERRSTADYFTHFGGDVIAGVESSHAVSIGGRSTGGVIEAFGDDTNVSLTVRAKNTGLLTLGNSSNRLNLVGSSINIGGASSIVIAPTATAGVTIGNSSTPIMINGSTGGIRNAANDHFTWGTNDETIGNSSGTLTIASTGVLFGSGSTTSISRIQRLRVDFTVPEIAANAVVSSTYTATALATNSVMMFHSDALVAVRPNTVLVMPKCSTGSELRLDFVNIAASSIGTGLSTTHGYLCWLTF